MKAIQFEETAFSAIFATRVFDIYTDIHLVMNSTKCAVATSLALPRYVRSSPHNHQFFEYQSAAQYKYIVLYAMCSTCIDGIG